MTEFSWPVRVYYEDTDAGGVVYYANYLRYMERARTEMLRSIGFEQDKLAQENNIIFIVRKVSMLFEQTILNKQNDLLCQAEIKIACINSKTMKPVSIPAFIISELAHVD